MVRFILNGERVERQESREMTLLRYLREKRGLTGTKNGWGTNHCGACTVLVDDRPTQSCFLRLSELEGKNIETIEGMTRGEKLHPIQAAFLVSGAVQCGFCTPGMILSTKALPRSGCTVAIESLLDEASRRLGLDPFEIRLKNALVPGDRTISG